MKSISFLILFACATTFLQAQTEAIQHFYNKYKNMEEVTHLKLQGWVLQLAAKHTDDDEAGEIFKKITQLRFLSIEEGNPVTHDEWNKLVNSLHKDDFEDLIQVRDEGDRINCYIRSKDDLITDVVLVISGKDEFLLLSLEGKLRFSDLNDLDLEVKGSEHFKNLPDDRSKLPKA